MSEGGSWDLPYLDHVSLVAERAAFEEAGFRVADTEGVTHHSRVFFDRTYLEVTPPVAGERGLGSRGWFLRLADAAVTADLLRTAGLSVEGPDRYRGEDGVWLDLTISGPSMTALPTLTRRIDVPEAAWPPAIDEPHPNGALRLAALHLRLRDPAPLVNLLEVLGIPAEKSSPFVFPGEKRLLIETGAEGPDGIVAIAIDRPGRGTLELVMEPLGD
jgi:hypothetical protein